MHYYDEDDDVQVEQSMWAYTGPRVEQWMYASTGPYVQAYNAQYDQVVRPSRRGDVYVVRRQ